MRELEVLATRRASLHMRRHFDNPFGAESVVEIISQPLYGGAAVVQLALALKFPWSRSLIGAG